MREQQANKMYLRELFGTMAVYFVALFGSNFIADQMSPGLERTLVIITPIIPALLLAWVIVRQFRRIDEYIRRWSLENIGISAAITAAFALSYGFMESAGFPRLSMFVIWGVLMGSWAVITCIRGWLERSQ